MLLNVQNFFGSAGQQNHISLANLRAILPATLVGVLTLVNTSAVAQGVLATQQGCLANAQLTAIVNAQIPGFNQNPGQLGMAGNTLVIAQKIASPLLIASAASNAIQSGLSEIQEVIATGYQGEVTTGTVWAMGSTITVSTANFTQAQQQALSQVLSQYAGITGLSFKTVDSGGQINISFGNLNTPSTGSLGITTNQAGNGFMQGSQIELEDPAQIAIGANGFYEGTNATFTQLLLHEFGHALGLADNNVTDSIENFYLGINNQNLSNVDIATLQALYGQPRAPGVANANPAMLSLAGLDQLIQVMAQNNAPTFAVGTSVGVFASHLSGNGNTLTLVSPTLH